MNLLNIGKQAKAAAKFAGKMSAIEKNNLLKCCAEALTANSGSILSANAADVEKAINDGIKGAFIDRLTLNEQRISQMADGLNDIARLNDPVGEVLSMKTMPNGLKIGQKRVALGVIGIIYEARPNVTADAFGLCLKAGSAVILRGGKEAIRSNKAIVDIFRDIINKNGFDENLVQLIEDTSRDTAAEFMRLDKYVDVLIPRGGSGLINAVVQNSTIPVIKTGTGNCHIFVDESADFNMAANIIINAKTSRPGVCNAAEKLLVHKDIADGFLPLICRVLEDKGVAIRGDEKTAQIYKNVTPAANDDWQTEYEDLIICIGVVDCIDDAIDHISEFSSNHSECIVTESYKNAQKFLDEIDSAAVYVNASTRFTDGAQFGMGAEIGISTQKLHARGPMGLAEMTTTKYIIYGNGQIRS